VRMGMTARRVPSNARRAASAALLTGLGLGLVGLIALWLLVPIVGAVLTLILGASLAAAGLRMLGSAP
jgi:heme O synthase-like polyprenyltransferase